MGTKRFNTPFNYKSKKEYHETVLGKSMTIQGESYTVDELLERSLRGLGTTVAKKAIWADAEYFDDVDLEQAQNMDLADIQALNQEVKDRIKFLEEKLEAEANTNPDNLQTPEENEEIQNPPEPTP